MNTNSLGIGAAKKVSSGGQRVAVYELAKELGLSHQDLLSKIHSLGIEVKNHMSRLLPEEITQIKSALESGKPEETVTVEERLSDTVIRRRSKEGSSPKTLPNTVPSASPVVRSVPKERPLPQKAGITSSDKTSPILSERDKNYVLLRSKFPDKKSSEVQATAETGEPLSKKENQSEHQVRQIPKEAPPETTSLPSVLTEKVQSPTSSEQKEREPTPLVDPSSKKLGPTGRMIDLASLRLTPMVKQSPMMADRNRNSAQTQPARGPRQEVSGERIRNKEKEQGFSSRNQTKSKTALTPKKVSIPTTAAEHKRVVRMQESIPVKELANAMGVKATEVLKKVWDLGMRSVMINSLIDFDTAQLVAGEFEWRVESVAFQEASVVETKKDAAEDLRIRAPVITIMGHVDHGKTSLLDAIRNANVASGEAGGITQHIGAYKVRGPAGDVVFLDTPGHEAFTEMRARGAQATDIVVLVVAADDGVMPQTLEALNHAKDAKVPIVVAVNKIDKPGAQPDRIRQQLAAYDLSPEDWGGQTIYVDVSARTKAGIDKLLEMLALQAEVLELKANPDKAAKGIVIEARMDAKRGPVSTILVQEGTLRVGESVVVGEEMGKVRAMADDKGKIMAQAGPSTPVEVLGLSGVPKAGDILNAVADDRAAKELVEHRRGKRVERDRARGGPVSLDRLMDAMKAGLKDLKIILKADVQGSVEALQNALTKLSTSQVKVTVIQAGVGGITESDVNLAKAGNAVIIGFHVRPAGKASALAEQEGVDIKLYDIIYDAIEDIKKASAGLLAPVKKEKSLGKAEVRQVFHMSKVGVVAGCHVIEGSIRRNAPVRLIRDSVPVYQGRLGSLKRFKDDTREVAQGYECGLTIDGYNDLKAGDIVECFEIEEFAPTFESMT